MLNKIVSSVIFDSTLKLNSVETNALISMKFGHNVDRCFLQTLKKFQIHSFKTTIDMTILVEAMDSQFTVQISDLIFYEKVIINVKSINHKNPLKKFNGPIKLICML